MRRHAIAIFGIVLLAAHASLYAGYVIDDAWISFRYARNVAHGLGLVFQEGERVEGYTNFLWVVLAAPFAALELPLEAVMPAIGLACACATAALAIHRARRDDRRAPLAGLPTAVLLAIALGMPFHAVAGLETPLFALLLLVAELALTDRRPLPFAIATTLAFLTRPEAALLGLGGTLFLVVHDRRAAARALAIFIALVTPYLAWKLWYFGDLLPNTLRAKPPALASGLRYLALELGPFGGLVIAAIARARSDAGARPLVFASLAFCAAIPLEGGDWMPGGRMVVPHLAPLAIAADPIVRAWLRPSSGRMAIARAVAAAAILAIAPIEIARALDLSRGVSGRISVDAARRDLASHLESRHVRSVALLDIGLLGWRAPAIRIVDLGGLVDPVIAREPGAHGEKRADLDYLESLAPDVVILTSGHDAELLPDGTTRVGARFVAEQHLETSSWLRERYAYVGTFEGSPAYRMHLFERRETRPLTSGGGGASRAGDRDTPRREGSRTARR